MSRRPPPLGLTPDSAAELAKLHCLAALFQDEGAVDPYVHRQRKEAIELALTGEPGASAPLERFHAAALDLVRRTAQSEPSFGLQVVDIANPGDLDSLFLRQRLVNALRGLAGHRRGLLAVTGVRSAVAAGGRSRRRARLAEAHRLIESLVARHAPARTAVTLICA